MDTLINPFCTRKSRVTKEFMGVHVCAIFYILPKVEVPFDPKGLRSGRYSSVISRTNMYQAEPALCLSPASCECVPKQLKPRRRLGYPPPPFQFKTG